MSAETQIDPSLNAEQVNHESLTYWQLVAKRFVRNRYGMLGLIGSIVLFFLALFSGFLAPYSAQTADRAAIYQPPQIIRIISPEGGLTAPYVMGFEESFDPVTFEVQFAPSEDKIVPIAWFVRGDTWSFLGLESDLHLFGGADGQPIHLVGTDGIGRDVFSQLLHGGGLTLLMAILVMSATCIVGTIIGISSGYFGGLFDTIAQRVVEFIKAFPDLPLYLALLAILPKRADALTVFVMFAAILVILRWADLSRELRGKVIAIRSVEYVRAAVAVGAGNSRIIFRHIFPNMSSHIIVWATFTLPEVILLESFLSFPRRWSARAYGVLGNNAQSGS